MALGQILREARERKGLTIEQVAESTRMLQQIVEDLEVEHFKRIAAPLYGRSFVKLYAACVDLDPAPLVEEFNLLYAGIGVPSNIQIRDEQPTVPRGYVPPKPVARADRLPPPAPQSGAEEVQKSGSSEVQNMEGERPREPQDIQPSALSPQPSSLPPPEEESPPDDSVFIVDEPPPEDNHDLFNYGSQTLKSKPTFAAPEPRGTSAPLPQTKPKSMLRRVARHTPTAKQPAAPSNPPGEHLRQTALRFWNGLDDWRKAWNQPPIWFWVAGGAVLVVFFILLATALLRPSKSPNDPAPGSRYVLEPPEFYAD